MAPQNEENRRGLNLGQNLGQLRSATLCFLVRGDEVLLAMKKRGFGVNRWNGAGGKQKDGETIEQTMIRETAEEILVTQYYYKQYSTGKYMAEPFLS